MLKIVSGIFVEQATNSEDFNEKVFKQSEYFPTIVKIVQSTQITYATLIRKKIEDVWYVIPMSETFNPTMIVNDEVFARFIEDIYKIQLFYVKSTYDKLDILQMDEIERMKLLNL